MKKSYTYTDILCTVILVILIATSAFPSFLKFKALIPILFPFILYRIMKVNKMACFNKIFLLLSFLSVFTVIHLALGHFTLIGGVSFLLSILTFASFAVLLKDRFVPKYVKIIKFFCYSSLLIWGLLVVFPGFHNLLTSVGNKLPQMFLKEWMDNTSNPGVSIYIYYIPDHTETAYTSFIRNNGPFYEPGLFASYIIIALLLNTVRLNKLFHRDNFILIACLLSTCSSAGYISFLLVVLYSVFMQRTLHTKLISILLIALAIVPIMELDFMAGKVTANMEQAEFSSSSRFGAILYHYEKIVESPLFGYAGGELPSTAMDRFLGDKVEKVVSPNGISFAFVYWGIPLAIVFYVLLYKGFMALLTPRPGFMKRMYVYIVLLSTAFSQTVTTEPIFLIISLFPIICSYERSKKYI